MRRFGPAVLTTTATVALLLAASAPARAVVGPSPDPLATSVSTPLLADCSRVTESGREYARRHGVDVCGAATTPAGVALRTEAVGGEECGALTLTATSWGGGVAAVRWTAASVSGPIARVDLALSISGRTGTTVHRFAGRTAAGSASEGLIGYVGAGPAAVTISGTVETATVTCSLSSAAARLAVR